MARPAGFQQQHRGCLHRLVCAQRPEARRMQERRKRAGARCGPIQRRKFVSLPAEISGAASRAACNTADSGMQRRRKCANARAGRCSGAISYRVWQESSSLYDKNMQHRGFGDAATRIWVCTGVESARAPRSRMHRRAFCAPARRPPCTRALFAPVHPQIYAPVRRSPLPASPAHNTGARGLPPRALSSLVTPALPLRATPPVRASCAGTAARRGWRPGS